jgi:hypothetical protein
VRNITRFEIFYKNIRSIHHQSLADHILTDIGKVKLCFRHPNNIFSYIGSEVLTGDSEELRPMSTNISDERITRSKPSEKPENANCKLKMEVMFLRNVEVSPNYVALQRTIP